MTHPPRKIIIDTDPGQDDAFAILLALASPEDIEVLGITAVAGNVPLALTENPDILATIAQRVEGRPGLVIGFAAETQNVVAYAQAKRARKGCDWIVANDVSAQSGIPGGVMGGDSNEVRLITEAGVEAWPPASKSEVAARLIARIIAATGPEETRP